MFVGLVGEVGMLNMNGFTIYTCMQIQVVFHDGKTHWDILNIFCLDKYTTHDIFLAHNKTSEYIHVKRNACFQEIRQK